MTEPIRIRTRGEGEGTELALDPDDVSDLLTPTRIELLRAVATGEPGSIRASARLVERDVKNVHGDLRTLADLGVVEFEWTGNRCAPVADFEELVVSVPVRGGN